MIALQISVLQLDYYENVKFYTQKYLKNTVFIR